MSSIVAKRCKVKEVCSDCKHEEEVVVYVHNVASQWIENIPKGTTEACPNNSSRKHNKTHEKKPLNQQRLTNRKPSDPLA